MKKRLILTLALLLVLCLCACQQAPEAPVITEYTFPEGTSILGVNVAGMNRESGWKAVEAAVSGHTLQLSVDGVETTISAEALNLRCSQQRYEAIADALEAGAQPEFTGLISFNEGKLRQLIHDQYNKPVTEAAIVYDEASGAYVLTPDAVGQSCNPNAIVDTLRQSILNLNTAPQMLKDVSVITQPERRDEDESVIQALETVNKMNTVALTYNFTVNGTTNTHTIPAESIRSFISVGIDGVTPGINYAELEPYVAELAEKYSSGGRKGDFKTTGGGTVGLTVSYNGINVDQQALVDDIAQCILEGTSGTRTAPYLSGGIQDKPYGGTYIEVNLSSQHLWFYKYGECIVSTSLVSGKVSEGMYTPTGIYSIYSKSTNTYLTGEGYRSFVNYWMPFYGGYGLHDATWRGSFGGEIYLYGGSHGCVNLPLSAAAAIYNNAPVGTKVILYGGSRSVPPQSQSLSGTTSYDVADDVGTITLNISARYGKPTLTYTSSNPSVASVSGNVVTIHGVGSATITVSASAVKGYTATTTSVSINVHSACDEGRHKFGTPTVVTAPTCQPGLETVTCSKCSKTIERELPAVESHSYGNWTVVTAATCGTEGTEEHVCTKCNIAKETRSIPATGQHTPGSPVTTKAPTCSHKGTTETRCSVCNTVIATGELDIVPDAHEAGAPQVTAATCTTDGKKETFCVHCGVLLSTEVIPAGHTPGDWQITQYPTCTQSGSRRRVCTVCGAELASESIPATGHNYSGGSCINCGEADPNYVPPTEAAPSAATRLWARYFRYRRIH